MFGCIVMLELTEHEESLVSDKLDVSVRSIERRRLDEAMLER